MGKQGSLPSDDGYESGSYFEYNAKSYKDRVHLKGSRRDEYVNVSFSDSKHSQIFSLYNHNGEYKWTSQGDFSIERDGKRWKFSVKTDDFELSFAICSRFIADDIRQVMKYILIKQWCVSHQLEFDPVYWPQERVNDYYRSLRKKLPPKFIHKRLTTRTYHGNKDVDLP